MKKEYIMPKCEVVKINLTSVICTSDLQADPHQDTPKMDSIELEYEEEYEDY